MGNDKRWGIIDNLGIIDNGMTGNKGYKINNDDQG